MNANERPGAGGPHQQPLGPEVPDVIAGAAMFDARRAAKKNRAKALYIAAVPGEREELLEGESQE